MFHSKKAICVFLKLALPPKPTEGGLPLLGGFRSERGETWLNSSPSVGRDTALPSYSRFSFLEPWSGPVGWVGRAGEKEEVEDPRPSTSLPWSRAAAHGQMDRWSKAQEGMLPGPSTTHTNTPHTQGPEHTETPQDLAGPSGAQKPSCVPRSSVLICRKSLD